MVKMIRDNTGRFAERPFYRERDLDDECERLIRDLGDKRMMMLRNHGVLTVGRTVAEAYARLYMVHKAAR